MKKSFKKFVFSIRKFLLVQAKLFKNSVNSLYEMLLPIIFFFKFLFHRYDHCQFDPRMMKQNLLLLTGALENRKWFSTTREGKLILLDTSSKKKKWYYKNRLLLGALWSRLSKVIYLSFLTFLIELTNPFDKETLRQVVFKKLQFVRRLLPNVYRLNHKQFDIRLIEEEMHIYEMRSFLQYRIIKSVISACTEKRQLSSVLEAKRALKKGFFPILSIQGCSGAYWMRNTQREILGIFKPFDEEIHAPNNPVGPKFQGALGERKTRIGIKVGEALHREVAAYIVDQFFGFGIVPHTSYASFTHQTFFDARENLYGFRKAKTKYGSFQEFVGGFRPINELNPSERAHIALDEYQLLVVLDIILGNTDRNAGNFLVSDEKIAAIDHGLCFPDIHDHYSVWYWQNLEIGKAPFLKSILSLLDNFPFEELFWKLKKHCYIEYRSLLRMKERIVLVQEAVNAGLNSAALLAPLMEEPKSIMPLSDLSDSLRLRAQEIVQEHLLTKKING